MTKAENASDNKIESIPENEIEKKKRSHNMVHLFSGIAVLVIIIVVILSVQGSNLKKELQKEWLDTDGSIIKVLEFTDDEVEYRLETSYSWMDTTLFNEKYKVVSGNKIKVQMFGDEWETYTIVFNDEKTVMTISPAMTSPDDSEKWYYPY